MTNHEAVVRSALSSSDLSAGGYLNAEQSDKFLRGVIAQPTLLKTCRTVLINGESKKIEKIGFGQRIMRPATENTALTADQYSKPSFGKVELITKEAIAEVRISYDTLENNIEGTQIKNTIISMIQERVALDLEELMINGDTGSADTYLALTNGIIKKASSHIIDANGASPDLSLFRKLIGIVPPKYRRQVPDWRIYTSHDLDLDWKEKIAARNTVAGDRFLLQSSNATALGFEIQPCAMVPVSETNRTLALLTHPQNLIAGFTRRVQIETDKDISARQIIIVVTVKADFAIEESDACGLLKNVGVNASGSSPTDGTRGVYYYEMSTAYANGETVTIGGVTYTKAATENVASKQFAGTTMTAQITSLAKMVTYGGFTVTADGERLVFTQLQPTTDFAPTLFDDSASTTGKFDDLVTVVTAASPIV